MLWRVARWAFPLGWRHGGLRRATYATAGADVRTLHRLLVFVPHAATAEELDVILHGCRLPEQFTPILAALDTRQDWGSMQAVLEYMKGQGVSPNHVHYTLIIAALGRARRMDLAKVAFQEAATAGEADVNTWTAMMDAWYTNQNMRNVVSLFEALPAHSVRPTTATYNVLIRAFVAWKQPDEALKAFEAMKADGLTPTAQTFAAVLPACHTPMEAEAMLEALPDPTVLRNAVPLWDVLAAKYCQARNLPAALEVVARMEEHGCRPDVRLFETLAKGCVECDDGHHAREVLSMAQLRGLSPSAGLLSAVVEACGKGGLPTEALATFDCLEEFDLKPTPTAVEAVLRACIECKEWQRGLTLGHRWQRVAARQDRLRSLLHKLRKGDKWQPTPDSRQAPAD